MPAPELRVFDPLDAAHHREGLVELLQDSVRGGASVNFVLPMTRAKAGGWWKAALTDHSRGGRVLIAALDSSGAGPSGPVEAGPAGLGAVQLILAVSENQPFHAEVAKMLVHSRARRRGLGARLLQAAEDEARRIDRTLLTLDTETGSAGERLYLRAGWTRFGVVPGYALNADGTKRADASFFYKDLRV